MGQVRGICPFLGHLKGLSAILLGDMVSTGGHLWLNGPLF